MASSKIKEFMEALSLKETFCDGGPIVVRSTTLLKATRLLNLLKMQSSENIESMLKGMIWCSQTMIGLSCICVLLLLMTDKIPLFSERVFLTKIYNRHLFPCTSEGG